VKAQRKRRDPLDDEPEHDRRDDDRDSEEKVFSAVEDLGRTEPGGRQQSGHDDDTKRCCDADNPDDGGHRKKELPIVRPNSESARAEQRTRDEKCPRMTAYRLVQRR